MLLAPFFFFEKNIVGNNFCRDLDEDSFAGHNKDEPVLTATNKMFHCK